MTITARHALVTGGSRGIALKLADHGVYVARRRRIQGFANVASMTPEYNTAV